jgi:hypothetical protein
MRRCRAWRWTGLTAGHLNHEPGTCKDCWRPCRQQFHDEGVDLCPDCEAQYANHPSPVLRLKLVNTVQLRRQTYQHMTTDGDPQIAMIAADKGSRVKDFHIPQPPPPPSSDDWFGGGTVVADDPTEDVVAANNDIWPWG